MWRPVKCVWTFSERWSDMRVKLEAVLLVAVIMAVGYLCGMVATDSVRAWLETMPV